MISAFDGTLALGLLPVHLFPSGHVFFIQRQAACLEPSSSRLFPSPHPPIPRRFPSSAHISTGIPLFLSSLRQSRALGVTPIAVHLTFQNCDQSGKRHRIREAQLWAVDPQPSESPAKSSASPWSAE